MEHKTAHQGMKAKKIRLIIIIVAMIGLLSVCAVAVCINGKVRSKLPEGLEFLSEVGVPNDAVLPPSISAGNGKARYEKTYSIKEAYADSDAVCFVTIGNYLGQDDWSTDYEAEVETCLKGELPEVIRIRQFVKLERTFPYSYGDKLLVFLTESKDSAYEDSFEVVGADISSMYAAVSKKGDVFLLDSRGIIGLRTLEEDNSIHNFGNDARLSSELKEYLSSFDPNAELICSGSYIFSYNDVAKILAGR